MSEFFYKPFKDEIVNVHLNSGEDIIGVVTVTDGDYIIKRPVIPNVSMDPDSGKFRVGLMPLRPYLGNLEVVVVSGASVAFAVACPEQMSTLYTQFTSNIYLASVADMPKGKITL